MIKMLDQVDGNWPTYRPIKIMKRAYQEQYRNFNQLYLKEPSVHYYCDKVRHQALREKLHSGDPIISY